MIPMQCAKSDGISPKEIQILEYLSKFSLILHRFGIATALLIKKKKILKSVRYKKHTPTTII